MALPCLRVRCANWAGLSATREGSNDVPTTNRLRPTIVVLTIALAAVMPHLSQVARAQVLPQTFSAGFASPLPTVSGTCSMPSPGGLPVENTFTFSAQGTLPAGEPFPGAW